MVNYYHFTNVYERKIWLKQYFKMVIHCKLINSIRNYQVMMEKGSFEVATQYDNNGSIRASFYSVSIRISARIIFTSGYTLLFVNSLLLL